MDETCKDSVTSSFGQLIFVDKRLNYEDSVNYCKKYSSVLAPINSVERFNFVRPYLEPCEDGKFGRLVKVRQRSLLWGVGLHMNYSKGFWSDGKMYDAKEDDQLFEPRWTIAPSKKCNKVLLNRLKTDDKFLYSAECFNIDSFICWKPLSLKSAESIKPQVQEKPNLAFFTLIPVFFVVLFFLILIYRKFKKKKFK